MSFDDVYRQHRAAVRTRVMRVVGPELCDDATQAAWIKIWRTLPDYRGDCALSSWLYRVATTAAIDTLRHARRQARRLDPHTTVPSLENVVVDPAPSPAARHRDRCAGAAAVGAIAALRPDYRAVVSAACCDEMKLGEVAAALRIPLGTVKSRLYRGRRILVEQLQDYR